MSEAIGLMPNEKELIGNWIISGSKLVADTTSHRIEKLIANYLIRLSADASGWFTLYKDPEDNRYWELYYPESAALGGGAPCLRCISPEDAHKKFDIA